MTIQQETISLPNGVRIAHTVKEGNPCLGIRIYTGTLHDPVGQCGLAHFVEHLIMAAPAQSGTAFMHAAEEYCFALSATTHHDFVQFTFGLKNTDAHTLAFILNGIFNAPIEKADFEEEKAIILDELGRRQTFDTKHSRHVIDIFGSGHHASLWGGEYEHMQVVSDADVYAFYRNVFQKRGVEVVAIGDMDTTPIDAFFAHRNLTFPAWHKPPMQKAMIYRAGTVMMPTYGHLHPDCMLGFIVQNTILLKLADILEARGFPIEDIAYDFYDLGYFAISYWHIEKPFKIPQKIMRTAFNEALNSLTKADFIAGRKHMESDSTAETFSEKDMLTVPTLWMNHFYGGNYWETYTNNHHRFTWADCQAYIDAIKKAL